MKATRDVRHPESNEIIVKEGRKFTKAVIRQMEAAGVEQVPITLEEVIGRVSAHDIVDPKTGEVLVECNQEITQERYDLLRERGISTIDVLFIDDLHVGPSLRNTLLQDKIASPDEAIMEIYRRLRPGDPPTPETATAFFHNLFFNPDRYDLSKVGRLKLNHKLKLNVPLEQGTLRREDILEVVRYLIELKNGNGQIDDIDHLGNRRVRAVGELVENQYRIGLVRMERAIKERMSLQDIETLMPQELINYKPVSAVIKEFFGSSQLSQFMDQTNPLSEITHKRRLSALGPGGLTRERAGFEVRDVHPTHYGRVCPIETPEGPNIGLIASLSTYARVNDYGFVETPYREVEKGARQRATSGSSPRSRRKTSSIAQANAPHRRQGRLHQRPGLRAHRRRLRPGATGSGRVHGRLAEPASERGGVADPVPRERRRQPRAHGLEHAAPGGAAAAHRRAARRYRHGARRGARLRGDGRRRAATASSRPSTPRASSSRPTSRRPTAATPASTSTTSSSTSARTRTPASTSGRSSSSATG